MARERHELVVVGGGISGLGFAHLAGRSGIRPLVLEAAERAGGCIRSHRFATPDGEYWVELGAHTCFNSYGTLLQILEDLDLLSRLQEKQRLQYRLLTGSGLHKIFSQLNLFELLRSLPRIFRLQKDQLTVAEYFGRLVGRRNFERVIGPALDAVICQPAAQVPAASLFRKKPRRKEVLRSFTGPAGLQFFSDAVSAQAALEVRSGVAVSGLEQLPEGFLLQLEDGGVIECSRLVLAVAPDVAAGLLSEVQPELARRLGEIEMAEIESLSLLVRAERLELEPVAGIIAAGDEFYSAVSRDPVPDPRYRAFTFHFRPGRLSGEGRMNRACEVLHLQPQDVLDTVDRHNRLPALRIGQQERIAEVDRLLAPLPLALTGNWFTGVSIEDCLTRSSQECRRMFGGL
jgi:oxygen-dependent protoporphyrinogen oxidase